MGIAFNVAPCARYCFVILNIEWPIAVHAFLEVALLVSAWLLFGMIAGVGFQLWVASVNYAQNAPEGYNAVKDVRVRQVWF
jgi:hypothetical protein